MVDPTDRQPAADAVVTSLEHTFASYAQHVPPPAGLVAAVRHRRRRRTVVQSAVGGGAALAVAVAILVPMTLRDAPAGHHPAGGGDGVVVQPTVSTGSEDPPADGWRWESYGGIELQVPDTWGVGVTGYPWCLSDEGASAPAPYVGRPGGPIPAIGCRTATPSEMGNRFVWFDSPEGTGREVDGAWVRETREVGPFKITIQLDDAAMVESIFASVRDVGGEDTVGCASDHVLANARDDVRPAVPWEAGAAEDVTGGSVCRYALAGSSAPSGPDRSALTGSRRLDQQQVKTIMEAVAAAPTGSGPNDPGSCLAEGARGDEVIVVTVQTGDGPRELFVRYSGCDHHGVDDGSTVRQLTPDAGAAIFDRALLPRSWSGVMDPIFTPLWTANPE